MYSKDNIHYFSFAGLFVTACLCVYSCECNSQIKGNTQALQFQDNSATLDTLECSGFLVKEDTTSQDYNADKELPHKGVDTASCFKSNVGIGTLARSRVQEQSTEIIAAADNAISLSTKNNSVIHENEHRVQQAPKENSTIAKVSWELKGRRAISIPSAKVSGGAKGKVVINIKVDRNGNVVFAEVEPSESSVNVQMKENARSAARKTKFNVSSITPSDQEGRIIYEF